MSFISKDNAVENLQLSVQEVSVKLGDQVISATSGNTITVQFNETITAVSSALFIDDSASTCAPVTAANRTVSGTTVAFTLSAAFAVSDALIIRYSTAF
jgi:predicted transcriptional regulator